MGISRSKMAVASLIFGVLSFLLLAILFGPLAIVFGCIALGAIRNSSGALSGRGLAIAGIVLGVTGLVLFFLLLPIVTTFKTYKIPTSTMVPTINPGDKILVDKSAYKHAVPKRGDIVVFMPPHDRIKPYLKRIVGLPGEKIEIRNGIVYINGNALAAPEISRNYYYNQGDYAGEGQVVVIPQGKYFVLGDNSIASFDSRFWGFVDEKDIIGKIKYRWFPHFKEFT